MNYVVKSVLLFNELLLWRATCMEWKVRRKESQPFPGADTFLWKTPAFSLSPSVLLYMNKWFWITDNQGPSQPEVLGSVDIWNYLQIWAFPWKEDKSFIQLSVVSVIPCSLNRHHSYGLCWSGQAPPVQLTLVSIHYSVHFCLLSSCPPASPWLCLPKSLTQHFRSADMFLSHQSPLFFLFYWSHTRVLSSQSVFDMLITSGTKLLDTGLESVIQSMYADCVGP